MTNSIISGRDIKNDNETREHTTLYGAKLRVEKGDTIAYIHHNRPLTDSFIERCSGIAEISDEEVKPVPVIEKVVY